MVDCIKFLPSISTQIPSNIHRIQNRLTSEQITLPILLSTVNNNYQHDRTTTHQHPKRWIGRCPRDPPLHVNASDELHRMHTKVIDHEMARYYPGTTIDMSASIKIKQPQRNSNKEPLRAIIGTGTTVTSTSILTNVDDRSSRLFDTLSKHVTIKAEPLRSTNDFANNTAYTLSSWKKYWASSFAQRRRQETNDSNHVLYDSKCDEVLLATKDFVTIHNPLSHIHSENNSKSSASSIRSNSSFATNASSPTISDKQSSFIKEDSHICLPQILSSDEKASLMTELKLIEKKPLPPIQNNNTVINNDNEIKHKINTITTKIYRFPLPSNKPKTKKQISKQELLKPLEKKTAIATFVERKETTSLPNTSVSKRRRQRTTDRKSSTKLHQITTKKQQYISTVVPTTLNSKYERTKWDEPYVGHRCDPPTPPCSPLSIASPRDNGQDRNNIFIEQNSTNEVYKKKFIS
ncbi:unnamed protein product [Rotaria sp. Silwood1]|nr:unnamed protein product [Rotaria sp. Silwood1]CAF0908077.1 unnamed protein product [Rotaria sp. Silwood1]CAF3372528.1 unnamed protein product [Rotaria sp. Silwood1]CAF4519032.1 unnamed protein product [Rotaria sp. Silwood1]CAF4539118.1 unnamed protein product [Rotaria sp. Silwood1]